jgi:SlyX protein
MSPDPLQEQLIELQSQFAFQEDLLNDLNAIVVRQQDQIDALERELILHRERLLHVLENLPEKGQGATSADERPPHY